MTRTIHIDLSPQGRVHTCSTIDLPMSAQSLWGQMRDFRWFTTLDPFHIRIDVEGSKTRPGARIRIEHQFAGIRIDRAGRILTWREGVGYSFSDLSKRGVRRGFPHIYKYEVLPLGRHQCRLSVTVRGRWTAMWIPRLLTRLWLRWVHRQLAMIVRLQMLWHLKRRDEARRHGTSQFSRDHPSCGRP